MLVALVAVSLFYSMAALVTLAALAALAVTLAMLAALVLVETASALAVFYMLRSWPRWPWPWPAPNHRNVIPLDRTLVCIAYVIHYMIDHTLCNSPGRDTTPNVRHRLRDMYHPIQPNKK